jgi:hypothetical protein
VTLISGFAQRLRICGLFATDLDRAPGLDGIRLPALSRHNQGFQLRGQPVTRSLAASPWTAGNQRSMTLETLGNVGEFLGAVAVLISLIYLALQIRQNTRTVRSAAHQAWSSSTAELNMVLASNRDFARVFRTGSQDPTRLEPEERDQFNIFLLQVFNAYQSLFFQFRQGMIDEVHWQSNLKTIRRILSAPGTRSCWDRYSEDFLDPRFRDCITEDALGAPTAF